MAKILNRRELRAPFDEDDDRSKRDPEEAAETEEEEEDEEEDEEEEGDDEEEEEGDEDDEEAPKKAKKKKVVAKPKAPAKPKRTRAGKVIRLRVVWGVFNNSNQRVATYDYPQRAEADEHATRLSTEKKQTFFVQPVKEPLEDKDKEKEKEKK